MSEQWSLPWTYYTNLNGKAKSEEQSALELARVRSPMSAKSASVTRFWQNFATLAKNWFIFESIWLNFDPTLAKFICYCPKCGQSGQILNKI